MIEYLVLISKISGRYDVRISFLKQLVLFSNFIHKKSGRENFIITSKKKNFTHNIT